MISTLRPQQTIARTAQVSGFGYWSGRDVTVTFQPAPENSGLVFVRSDLEQPVRIPVSLENRIETPRRTTLSAGGATVEMVEHILAALAGLRVDNCEIHVDRPEMPGCDGSSLPFVEALLEAGVQTQEASRSQLIVTDVTRVGNDESWVEARPIKGNDFSVRYRLDYGPNNAIGRQTLQLVVSPDSFRKELAPARTFVTKEEADWLRSRGLGNRATYQDLLVFGEEGPIDNTLRFEDECVRHKTLDLVGDLALAGCDVVGQIIAHCSGHRLNAELARVLLAEGKKIISRRLSA